MEEIWKDIKDYEGLYQVSNLGNVKSLEFMKGSKNGSFQRSSSKVLKQSVNQKGYKVVVLYKNKKGKMFQVHRLVALAFLNNPNNFPIINHKDENPQNNVISNLEWCSQKYNCSYSIERHIQRHQTYEHKGSCKCKKPVLQYDLEGNYIMEFSSLSEASRQTGVNVTSIYHCCTGKWKYASGYKWMYKSLP